MTAPWQIWVDTGGTFTDCLARDPQGRLHRAKVLSSSALRGRVAERLDARTLRLAADWGAPADFIAGFRLRRLGDDGSGVEVEAYDPGSGRTRLAAPAPAELVAGAAFEALSPEEAPVLAARLVTGTPPRAPLPPLTMRLATTRGTNALLERSGAPIALFVTRGFRDLLRIGTQQRPELFALRVEREAPLYARVVEVPERLAADGGVVEPLRLEPLAAEVAALRAAGVEGAAVALLHAYRNPAHEEALEAFLRRAGFRHVSRSSALAPAIRILPRAETAVVDAYLSPVIGAYLAGVEAGLGAGAALRVMTSAGGLVRADEYRAKDSLLSGPAGGVVGAARAGLASGFARVIAFDMGGTSTDVARFDGDHEYVWEHRVGGAHLLAPALAIESVAAGGGSICALDANGLRVGPQSAGARPGPACYGAGGPLTLTDVNLLLGRLDPERFGIPLLPAAARERLEALCRELEAAQGGAVAAEGLLEGLVAIADERMADAIRGISLRRGYDPAEYALVAFGGAGAQHGTGVAERLGMRTVIVPADAGLLSALGLGHALLERVAQRQVLRPLREVEASLAGWLDELAAGAAAAVRGEGVEAGEVEVRRRIAELRFQGQESTLAVEYEPGLSLSAAFGARYQALYGHRPERREIEVESLRVIASTRPHPPTAAPPPAPHPARPAATRRAFLAGAWRDAPVFDRERLRPGASLAGPALVLERHSATVVDAGWTARVDAAGALVLETGNRESPPPHPSAPGSPRHPVSPPQGTGDREGSETTAVGGETGPVPSSLEGRGGGGGDSLFPGGEGESGVAAVEAELFTARFQALVGEMGEMLRRTALSTNVKERLDFSCGLLDAAGELVVNAPHIPVHLGALGSCVRAVREVLPLRPGDVVVTNHPAFGGSHLPDVTVITPVHDDAGALLGYLANRAHHAEIGGTRPGSMPPAARSLAEEGVVIAPRYLLEAGTARWAELRDLLTGAPHPTRAVEDNLADLRAQVAANHRGAELLRALVAAHGAATVAGHMRALTDRAERRVREALRRLPDGRHEALQRLDDGSPLRVAVEVRGDSAILDFTGSAPVHPGNLNATPAIVASVVLYVLRLLIAEPLPLNEGLLRPVELRLPEGLLNPPFPPDPARAPAVVGGNTEVSQRLVDTLLLALRLAACSQGTMNNVLWGSERFGYYETVCGGCGAGPGWAGASAVHSHMTNTRITDAEVVEHRYPVRVERFEIRGGSGGAGRFPGGDGVVRELRFLAPVELSLLTQHRVERPYGLEGGEPGLPGRQRVIRADGEVVELGPVDGCEVRPGDRLVLETPGGGGWGAGEG